MTPSEKIDALSAGVVAGRSLRGHWSNPFRDFSPNSRLWIDGYKLGLDWRKRAGLSLCIDGYKLGLDWRKRAGLSL